MIFKNYRYRILLKLANGSYSANLYSKTIELLLKANKLRSGNPSVYSVLAQCHCELNQFKKAYKNIKIAIKLDPKNFDYMLQEIVTLNNEGQLDVALSKFDFLPEEYQAQYTTQQTKAWTLFELGRIEQAKDIYEKLLTQNQNDSNNLLCIAECYQKLEDESNSYHYTKLALENDDQNPTALNNFGYKLLILEQYNRAIPFFKQSILIDPNHAFAYNNLGFAYLRTGKLNLAFKYINKSIKLDDKNSYALKNLALCFVEENKIDNAILNLTLAKELGYKKLYGNEVEELLNKLKDKT